MKYQARNNYLINWAEYPLLRISICFIIGICISDNYQISLNLNLMFLSGIIVVYTCVHKFFEHSRSNIRILSLAILLMGMGLGALRGNLQKTSNSSSHYSNYTDDKNILIGRICSEVKKKKRYTASIEVNHINGKISLGKLLVYFSPQDSIIDYQKGDVISCKGRIHYLKDNSNPRSFNYKSHLKYKGVDAQMFLNEGSHRLIEKDNLNSLSKSAYKIRKWALAIFERRLVNKNQLATACAMVLGYKEHLSDDLYQSFSETGAVHVLAVSGLHVGIICMIFIAFFNRFKSEDLWFKVIKLGTLLSVVWLYALVTGASPAVLRAAVMFSLILIGRLWFKGVNIYNILAFSALIILMYDPYLLFQLSFQFSYLALISIIFFQPRIEGLYETKHWITTKVWQLTSVSIAAQILIFPISIFYFHTFPTYFILSGVAAVFLATFILGFGLILLGLDGVPYLGDFFSLIYSKLLEIFIQIISGIQSLPYNNVEGVFISSSSVILCYISIATLMFILSLQPRNYKDILNRKLTRKRIAKLIIVSCSFLILLNNLVFNYRVLNQSELIVYDISKASVIDIFHGNHLYTLKSDGLDDKKVDYASKSYRIYNGNLQETQIMKGEEFNSGDVVYDGQGLLSYKNKLIVLAAEFEDVKKIPCYSDLLMVTHNSELEPDNFLKHHNPKQVILDNSIEYRLKKEWIKECQKRNILLHDIYHDGVFRLKNQVLF
jgi:competence protein ComEC